MLSSFFTLLGLRRTFQNYIVRPLEHEAAVARGILHASLRVTIIATPAIAAAALLATLAQAGSPLLRVGVLSGGLGLALIIALIQLASTLRSSRKS